MEINKEISEKIQELQIFERSLQTLSMEKQNLQVESNEISNALEELSKSGDEVYKILNGLMIKANKDSLSKDLSERKKLLDLRLVSIEKQESSSEEKAEALRNEINASFSVKAP
jgi:prefoldin beta subunit